MSFGVHFHFKGLPSRKEFKISGRQKKKAEEDIMRLLDEIEGYNYLIIQLDSDKLSGFKLGMEKIESFEVAEKMFSELKQFELLINFVKMGCLELILCSYDTIMRFATYIGKTKMAEMANNGIEQTIKRMQLLKNI